MSVYSRLILILLALTASPLRADQVSCPLTTYKDLQQQLKNEGPTEIIFFASWCSSCLPHLKAKHSSATILVAAFDERERAEKVLRSLDVKGRCFTSADIAETMGVKALPASKQVSF